MEQPKLCECGCGQPAPIAKKNDAWNGYVKGQPLRFLPGHNPQARTLFVEVGQRVGLGVVLETELRIPCKRRGGMVTVRGVRLRCDCGNVYEARLDRLLQGRNISCGCQRGRPGCRSDPARVARKWLLDTYRRNAKARGFVWELTDEDFFSLVVLDCFYCGQPPSMAKKLRRRVKHGDGLEYYDSGFAANGLDRMDNALGYTLENVAPCCETCNRAKRDMPYADFMAWIARLTMHHWFSPELTPSRLLKGGA